MPPTQTALIVPVPATEHAVAAFRASFDRAASWGVPAHVTVLYPFLPPDRVDGAVVDALRQAVRAVPRFDVTFARVEWFGDTVVWLAPEPDEPFRRLTTAVWQRFPEAAPYGGAFLDVVPHLTIGHDAPAPLLREAADAVRAHLPIRGSVDAVQLIAGSPEPGSWHTVAELPLASEPARAGERLPDLAG